jgi:F0F1-type ATP synthase assembly protein I
LTRGDPVRKGGAAFGRLRPASQTFASGEADAFIVANDPENAPIGHDPQLDSLESRIAAARRAEDDRMAREHAPTADGRSIGIQVMSTMVGYPLGGIVIGLVLDNYVFDTLPWITIGLMFLAFAGACLNVVRLNKNRGR